MKISQALKVEPVGNKADRIATKYTTYSSYPYIILTARVLTEAVAALMAEMEGEKHSEIKFERQRSYSVPIISQIEKVLDDLSGSESASFERETRTKNRRFSETRSPKYTTSQKSLRKLSSGGLMRNQKRGHVKTAVTERKQTSHRQKQARPRASTTGITTNPPRAVTHAHSRRERSKSLPLTRENYEQDEEIGFSFPKQKQTSKTKSYNKMLHQRSMSLPTCLQHKPKPEHSKTEDTALLSTINTSSSANFESFVLDLNKLSFDSLQQSEQEKQDIFSVERRRSWPFCLKKSNQSMESSVQISANFNIGLKKDSLFQKPTKIRIQRSKSLPLTGLSCDNEVKTEKKMMQDEVSREDDGCQHECGFRHGDALGEIILRKEHSRPREKTPSFRSKSLPLGLEIKSEANMSPNLMVKHPPTESLPSYDKLQDAVAKRRRAKSLPCIYESFTEKEILCKAQNIHHSKTDETGLNQKEKNKESEEITGKVDGNIERTIQLKRARSLPLSLAEEQQQSGNDHIRDDTQIKSDGEHQDFISRERSKSLPNILKGERSLSFSPVAMPELLEEDNDIPETLTIGENIYNTVSEVESEEHNSYLNEGNCISIEQDENGAKSKTRDASVLEANVDMHQPNPSYPHKLRVRARGFSIPGSFKMEKIIEEPSDIELRVRARGFSIPGSFKMEKIIEEPNDTERSQTESYRYEFKCREQNDTNNEYKTEEFFENNTAMSEKSPTEDFTASCNDSGTVFFHDNSRGQQDERQQVLDHENDLARLDKVVSQALAKVNGHEFSKSSSGLHRAAANGDLEFVKRLVEKGDDVNGVDESGWPVLHAAITTGNFDCGVWLIEAGADLINYTNFVIDEYRILSRQVYQNF